MECPGERALQVEVHEQAPWRLARARSWVQSARGCGGGRGGGRQVALPYTAPASLKPLPVLCMSLPWPVYVCREQDRFLPIANISRIMKKALPGNAKIAKDAKETMQECLSEFISFITSE